jgi:hypothetical protein
VVSLFVGLNVFLAGRTAELNVRIRTVERECQELEWLNAELVGEIALASNIDAADEFAVSQGFTSAQRFVHLAPIPSDGSASERVAPGEDPQRHALHVPNTGDHYPTGQTVLGRLRGLVSARSADERVATIR